MIGQLTLVEVRRLLRNPYLWAVVVAAPALLFPLARNQLPNLAEDTVNAAMFTFLIAGVGLLIANLATLRDQREGVPETLAALPGRADARTLAVLIAACSLVAVLVVVAIGGFLLVRLAQGTTGGQVDAREILAAAAGAAVMAAAGVALGRWAPTPIVAPIAIGILTVCFFLGSLILLSWHLPITAPYTTQVFGRPGWTRLAYLVAVLLLLAALAMLRHARRPRRLGIAAAALAAAVTAGVAVGAVAPPLRGGLVDRGDAVAGQPDRECTEHNAITYCYFPGFRSWVPYWEQVAEPIAAALPPAERHRMPVIEQRASFAAPTTRDGAAMVRMSWGRGEAGVNDRTELAGQITELVTGVPVLSLSSYFPAEGPAAVTEPSWCGEPGQASTVVALWLVAQAAPHRLETAGTAGEYAQALLDRAGARELIWQHWDRLLRVDGALLGAAAAFALADPMAGSTAAVPTPRWLRQWLRTAFALGYAATAWTVTYRLVAAWSGQVPPWWDAAVEAAVCVAVGLAGAGFAVRRGPERHAAAAGAATLFGLLLASLFLPARWSPWPRIGAATWDAAHAGWLAALPVVLVAIAIAHRDTRSALIARWSGPGRVG